MPVISFPTCSVVSGRQGSNLRDLTLLHSCIVAAGGRIYLLMSFYLFKKCIRSERRASATAVATMEKICVTSTSSGK